MPAWPSAGIAGNSASTLAGRNHLPDPPTRGSPSASGVSPDPASSTPGSASGLGAPGPAELESASTGAERNAISASLTQGSASVERDSPLASAASGITPASAAPGSMSASHVMSSLPPEPVLTSSANGLALPSSVAGRDGTRLKYRPGLALRTNSRVARKCPCSPRFLVGASATPLNGCACPGFRRPGLHPARRARFLDRVAPSWRHPAGLKMSDPRVIFEQTSKTTGHPGEFRFE